MSEALIPPQSPEAEESLLGAMMLSEVAIANAAEVVAASDFYRESHATIYRAILGLYERGEPADIVTVVGELERTEELDGAGGRMAVAALAHGYPTVANAEHYARLVAEKAILRGLIRAGGEISRLGWEQAGDAPDLLNRAEQLVFDLGRSRNADFERVGTVLLERFAQLRHLYEAGTTITGTPSGFRELDKLTAGLQPGNLVILAARPSMGKSALALNIATNVALRHSLPVAVYTLEMSKYEVADRLGAAEAGIDLQRMRTAQMDAAEWGRLAEANGRIAQSMLEISDVGAPTIAEVRSKARRFVARHPNCGLLVIDYLQLMTAGLAENRTQDVSQITRNLKLLARDLNVPILALSQLSRALEARADKRPLLSDLRESGSIEQDADLVIFIYRDDYYDADSDRSGEAEIIVRKHRNGPIGTFRLAFRSRLAKFVDMAVG